MLNAAWMLKDVRSHARAREALERALAFAREREIDIYVEYLVATGALIDLATGDWDAADAAAAGLVAQPRLANAVARIPALEVVGLVGLRRGQPGAREHLDEAWELARAAGELQRLRPIACARAEAAWLDGDAEAVDAATRDTLALALEVGHEWDVGELLLWRFRAGLPAVAPESCPLPIACELAGDAARRRAALGRAWASRTPRRSPCWAQTTPSRCSTAIALLDRLGATAVAALGRARLRRAGVARRPARAASRDAREPGRPDRPPARGARARGAGTLEPRDRAAAVPLAQDRRASRRGDAGQARRALPRATSRAPRAGLGSARRQSRGPARPSWGRLPVRATAPRGRSVGRDRFDQEVHMTVAVADTELKARHRAMWASGDYPSMVETFLLPLGPRLVAAAGIGPGMRVLDVAAGTGNASLPAADAGARVTAADLTPELLDAGRRRADAAGLELEWVQADAEHLPFDDESFDVVMSCIGVMFAPHHQDAADELVRVCRPGGTLALLSWTPEGMLGALFKTMATFAPPPPAGAQPPPLWGSEEHLRELLGDRVELHTLRARRARDHRLRTCARVRRALQVVLRADHRRAGERAPDRSRGEVRGGAGRLLRRVEPRRRRSTPASRRSTCSPSDAGGDVVAAQAVALRGSTTSLPVASFAAIRRCASIVCSSV